jgi:FkbM family methyltransferase
MLITDLQKHFTKELKGAIHIGAHYGEEKQWYEQNKINPVVWIEANPNYLEKIKSMVGDDIVIISGVGNENKKELFNVSNNGESSSFLELHTHKIKHPDVFYVEKIEIEIKRMTDLIKEYSLNMDDYNFLNLDIQGFELEALKGFDNHINNFDYIYSEVNSDYLYKDCALINEIDEYLIELGFQRVETAMWGDCGWGDALYKKNNI